MTGRRHEHQGRGARLRGVAADMANTMLPWPSRRHRRAEIVRARSQRIRAESDLARTRSTVRELRDIVYEGNHFADGIAGQLRQSYDDVKFGGRQLGDFEYGERAWDIPGG